MMNPSKILVRWPYTLPAFPNPIIRYPRPCFGTQRFEILLFCIGVAFASLNCDQATAIEHEWLLDWPGWKGPLQNRISAETGLVDTWDPKGGEGSNLLWKSKALAGRSTPVILGDKLYTLVRHNPGTPTEGEKVVCASTATGEVLWEHRFNVYLSDVPDTRVGWSSVTADPATGNVYALGVCGYFCCLNGTTGQVIWSKSLHEEYGLLSTYGGRTNVPVIFEDTVIISSIVIGWGDSPKWGLLAKPAHRFMALDKVTGEMRWLKGTRLIPYDTTYSTPTIAALQHLGMDAMIFGSGDGQVWALQPGTGLPIWKYPFSRRGLNTSPFVTGDGRIYMGHSEENRIGNTMGSIVALKGDWSGDSVNPAPPTDKSAKSDGVPIAEELWRHYEIMAGKSSPVEYHGRVYFVDDRAKMFIYDLDGKLIQRKALGTVMRSTPLFADGKIYLCTNNGRWWTLRPSERGVEVVQRLRLSGEASDGSPVVSRGRIFIPTSEYLYCIGKPNDEPEFDSVVLSAAFPISPPARGGDNIPTHVQVVPYDTLLAPGEKQVFRARLYNDHGDYLRNAKPGEAVFSVEGLGTIGESGIYQTTIDGGHECVLVSCQVGDLAGTARVRVVPPLPWSFDFEEMDDVPLTWVGGRVRYVRRPRVLDESDVGGSGIMVKRSELPTRPGAPTTKLGTRSRMWMGPVDMANYTMQADVMLPGGKQGDLGLLNSRYTFALYGASQEVRLYSWCTHDKRTQAAVPMKIDPAVWYALKLRVEPRGDEALVQGKVWPRNEAEPSEWTLQMTDLAPNVNGSPGLYGNAKNAEIFIDNIIVTAND